MTSLIFWPWSLTLWLLLGSPSLPQSILSSLSFFGSCYQEILLGDHFFLSLLTTIFLVLGCLPGQIHTQNTFVGKHEQHPFTSLRFEGEKKKDIRRDRNMYENKDEKREKEWWWCKKKGERTSFLEFQQLRYFFPSWLFESTERFVFVSKYKRKTFFFSPLSILAHRLLLQETNWLTLASLGHVRPLLDRTWIDRGYGEWWCMDSRTKK